MTSKKKKVLAAHFHTFPILFKFSSSPFTTSLLFLSIFPFFLAFLLSLFSFLLFSFSPLSSPFPPFPLPKFTPNFPRVGDSPTPSYTTGAVTSDQWNIFTFSEFWKWLNPLFCIKEWTKLKLLDVITKACKNKNVFCILVLWVVDQL